MGGGSHWGGTKYHKPPQTTANHHVSWVTFYQDNSNKFDPLKNMATTGQEQFSYEYIGKTYIKKLFAEFETDLVQMVLG